MQDNKTTAGVYYQNQEWINFTDIEIYCHKHYLLSMKLIKYHCSIDATKYYFSKFQSCC